MYVLVSKGNQFVMHDSFFCMECFVEGVRFAISGFVSILSIKLFQIRIRIEHGHPTIFW